MILIIIDAILIDLSLYLSFCIRFGIELPQEYMALYKKSYIIIIVINLLILLIFKQYNKIWRYANIKDILDLSFFISIGYVLSLLLLINIHVILPRSIYPLSWTLSIISLSMSRLLYRYYNDYKFYSNLSGKNLSFKNVLIIGGGSAGKILIDELKAHPELGKKPKAILDDDEYKYKRIISGVRVVGKLDDLKKVVNNYDIDEVIFAIPSAPKKILTKIVKLCSDIHIKLKTLPGIYELVDGSINVSNIHDVDISDLLGRDPVKLDLNEICGYIRGKKVMVTGGGGSIGSELCRQIANYSPSKLIILDIYENSMYDIQQELKRNKPELDLKCIVASIRDEKRIKAVFSECRPDIVFHAAAHKHVPLMEDNPQEAIKNNVYGTLNLAKYSNMYKVKRFVMISTDKAVNPTSVMGASKRICEMIVQTYDKISETEFVAVRFGNVLGSNGSVIPLFKKQIREGGPVTVTSEDIKRYFMTIPEAVQLVIQAGSMAKGGEIFVLDMGEPVKIIDLARQLISLSGFEPDIDIPIKITGLRPGEKMYEELLITDKNFDSTKHDKIFVEKPLPLDENIFKILETFKNKINSMSDGQVKDFIKLLVPEYHPDSGTDEGDKDNDIKDNKDIVSK